MALTGEAERKWRDFVSPGAPSKGIVGAVIASAATIAPTKFLHEVSGVAAISLITLPYDGFEGTIAIRPSGVFTLATGGVATALNKPVGLAATSVVGKTLFVTYDSAAGLWYPSYTA